MVFERHLYIYGVGQNKGVLSPLLFAIGFEPLAITITDNVDIVGIKILKRD